MDYAYGWLHDVRVKMHVVVKLMRWNWRAHQLPPENMALNWWSRIQLSAEMMMDETKGGRTADTNTSILLLENEVMYLPFLNISSEKVTVWGTTIKISFCQIVLEIVWIRWLDKNLCICTFFFIYLIVYHFCYRLHKLIMFL